MKKATIILAAAIFLAMPADKASAKPKEQKKQEVTFLTTMHCDKCAGKISENVSFEKGVKDLKTDTPSKTVKIVFDPSKTDTIKLATAIRKLGYKAKVIEFKDKL